MEPGTPGVTLPNDCWRQIVGYVKPKCTWVEMSEYERNRRRDEHLSKLLKRNPIGGFGGQQGTGVICINGKIINVNAEDIKTTVCIFTISYGNFSNSISISVTRYKYSCIHISQMQKFIRSIEDKKVASLEFGNGPYLVYDPELEQLESSNGGFTAKDEILDLKF